MANPNDQDRREQAWLDYCNLEALGISPNPNALYEYYRDKNRSNPELRASIPTTNRSTVYEWAKEEKWKERYAAKKKEESEIALQKYDSIRQNTYGTLVSFQQVALDTLRDVMLNAKDYKVRLQAAETVFDRTGLGKISTKHVPTDVSEQVVDSDALPAEMSEDDLIELFKQQTMNA